MQDPTEPITTFLIKQGGGGVEGFYRTPLLKSSIHMNLYCVYVGHTHLIENSTHFRKKESPYV